MRRKKRFFQARFTNGFPGGLAQRVGQLRATIWQGLHSKAGMWGFISVALVLTVGLVAVGLTGGTSERKAVDSALTPLETQASTTAIPSPTDSDAGSSPVASPPDSKATAPTLTHI